MFQTLKNAWRVPELKSKILFTLLIIVVYRLGSVIPVPFIDADLISAQGNALSGTIFEYMSFLSGQAFVTGTLFALSVSPYITSSIVMQLLTIAIPALERMAKEGEEGKKKISAITRVVTVALALITAFGYTQLLKSGFGTGQTFLTDDGIFAQVIIIACYCAGASLIMWLAERINEHGIGNGISMILFANIISGIPALLGSVWAMMFDNLGKFKPLGLVLAIVSIAITLAIVVMVVWFTESERRIPIQYAKRQVGRKMYGGQASHLPLKMNMAGVMPIIFASSICTLPATIMMFISEPTNAGAGKSIYNFFESIFSTTSPVYMIIYFALIIAFAYFYIAISFNPVEVANNLKKNGGFIPGIRPGKPTSDYISKILSKITLIGAIFLGFIAIFPMVLNAVSADAFAGIAFGGSSLLIVVGVALETAREIEAQMTMRHYKGFLQ